MNPIRYKSRTLKLVRSRQCANPNYIYFAYHDEAATEGTFIQCIQWGRTQLGDEVRNITIAAFKPKDKWARIFGVLTSSGYQFTRSGFVIPTMEVRKCLVS